MEGEVARWLSSISCGLDLKPLANEFEERGFTTKESLKYIDSSDLDIFFPSPLKLCYAKKKILLKEIEKLSAKPQASTSTVIPSSCNANEAPAKVTTSTCTQPAQAPLDSSKSFLAKKQMNMNDDIQFIQTRVSSAKEEYTRLLQQADDYDRKAPKRAKLCSNCHQPGHQKRLCTKMECPGIRNCNMQSKHPEFRSEIKELQSLIKELEKKSTKAKDELMDFKAAREKASNSFFAIMRPRLKKSNQMKYAGTDRLHLDRDLLILKKALNNKVPLDENSDWKLPLMIEEFNRRSVAPFQADNFYGRPSSSRGLFF